MRLPRVKAMNSTKKRFRQRPFTKLTSPKMGYQDEAEAHDAQNKPDETVPLMELTRWAKFVRGFGNWMQHDS